MNIDNSNIDDLIHSIWKSVKVKVEDEKHPLSSEKTLVFLFARELLTLFSHKNLFIDFENQCYKSLKGKSKYLDLLFYTDENYKVAIEFKLPTTNPTQTRESIYRDFGRLKYLKENSIKAQACYFLMATNKDSYLNNKNLKVKEMFRTEQGYTIKKGNNLIVEGLSLNDISCEFIWNNIDFKKETNKYVRNKTYAWLEPIRIN